MSSVLKKREIWGPYQYKNSLKTALVQNESTECNENTFIESLSHPVNYKPQVSLFLLFLTPRVLLMGGGERGLQRGRTEGTKL